MFDRSQNISEVSRLFLSARSAFSRSKPPWLTKNAIKFGQFQEKQVPKLRTIYWQIVIFLFWFDNKFMSWTINLSFIVYWKSISSSILNNICYKQKQASATSLSSELSRVALTIKSAFFKLVGSIRLAIDKDCMFHKTRRNISSLTSPFLSIWQYKESTRFMPLRVSFRRWSTTNSDFSAKIFPMIQKALTFLARYGLYKHV